MSRGAWGGKYTAVAIAALAMTILGGIGEARSQDRTLSFKQMHTGETLTVTYMRGGRYDAQALQQINHLMRDWRRDEAIKVDPKLVDIIWEIHRETGSRSAVHVLSGYRSPNTNAALRSRSSGVARNSQHMHGKALDFFLPDVPVKKLREVALRKQGGGVGYYPTSGSPFVHVDTGSVRHWPRMSRQQLASLFPDGKTVHVPSDGKPLARYEQAKIEIAQRRSDAPVTASSGAGRGLLAALFGGGRNRDTAQSRAQQPASAPVVAQAGTAPATQPPIKPEEPATAAPVALARAPVPEPRPEMAVLASLPPDQVPLPGERPVFMASLQPEGLSGYGGGNGQGGQAAGRLSRGAMEALIALAPDRAIDQDLPFSATFTEAGGTIGSETELVAIDYGDEAMQPFVTPSPCEEGPVLAKLNHPNQGDISELMQSAETVVVNWFEPRPAISASGQFVGEAVAPLASRSYRSAAL